MKKEKIDSLLLNCVYTLEDKKIKCVVWVKEFEYAKEKLEMLFDKDNILGEYPFLNAFGLKIKQSELSYLSEFGWISYISSVQKSSILLDKARKVIEVEELFKQGVYGQNVTVAIIDTGCYAHLDFMFGKNRIKYFEDFINKKKIVYDDNGHGTFVAGVLGGNGISNLKQYCGIAPACNLVVLKALDKNGETQVFTILDAMQWISENKEKYNIKIVCMSFGSTPLDENDPLIKGAETLWDNNIVVVSASGNDGPSEGTVKSPGASAKIITVGSADTTNDNFDISVAPFSSRGPSFSFIKPDLIAPGVDLTSTSNDIALYTHMSGTSVSTPIVAGVCALLLCKFPFLTPNQIKTVLMRSAIKIFAEPNACGSGLINAFNAFEYINHKNNLI